MEANANVSITELSFGPYAIVVTDPAAPSDRVFPLIISPPGGYQTKEEAFQYISRYYATRLVPYLGLHFAITRVESESDFHRFCSWEE